MLAQQNVVKKRPTIEPFGEVSQTAVRQNEEVDLGQELLLLSRSAFRVPPEELWLVFAIG